MVFRPRERNQDLAAVWKRNGEGLEGMTIPFIDLAMGADACRKLADEIESREIPSWGWDSLLPVWFSFGMYSRANNADFIVDRFDRDERILEARRLFLEVSSDYQDILDILADTASGPDRYRTGIPPVLVRIADREEAIGKLFMAMSVK